MSFKGFLPRSVTSQVIGFTLTIFLCSFWALSLWAGHTLQLDTQRMLEEQQFSIATVIGQQVNRELKLRMDALKFVASEIHASQNDRPAALQGFLEQRPLLLHLFNAGIQVVDDNGLTAAQVPRLVPTRLSDLIHDNLAEALQQGQATVGGPVMDPQTQTSGFPMIVPLHDAQGRVSGAIIGFTDLNKPNFLDDLSQGRYGKTGGFLLVAPRNRRIVAATDKRRNMELLPTTGAIPAMDHMLAGYEGTDIFVNARGTLVMNSSVRIPLAGWRAVVTVPAHDAFAPIVRMQWNLGLATLTLSALAAVFTWRVLKNQLTHLQAFLDPLTQLANRRMLDLRLGQSLTSSKRSGLCGALMILDLDNFKPLNDQHGHLTGDLLLIEVARRLKDCVREVDTVARFGGDEFVVVLEELGTGKAASMAQARTVAEKIRISLSQPYVLKVTHRGGVGSTVEHRCTASVGVVVFAGNEVPQEELLKRADAAMYQAKDQGRNAIRIYEETSAPA